jgi:hypothetical protein
MTLSLYFQAFDAVEFLEEGDGRYVGRMVLHDTIQVKDVHHGSNNYEDTKP